MVRISALLLSCALVLGTAPAGAAVVVPVEVVGSAGTTARVAVNIRAQDSARVRTLWLEIHGLSYAGMASVEINRGPWVPLNNKTVTVAEPGRSYGGIGGGFATLKMTLPLPPGALQEGANELAFRFNLTDGVASGFRVLAFNFQTADGEAVLPVDFFVEEDPSTWQPPRNTPADIALGNKLWHNAPLKANGLANALPIHAHCGDCHTADGRDLKYFNYSNASVIARAEFHGLTVIEGEQIASYIRSLPVPNPGRPWNPPYQPGLGVDAAPASNWAAGAGLKSVLDRDEDTLAFLFRGGVTPAAFRPDANLSAREVPIALQLPDWNHWLPRVHPLDAWGDGFARSRFAEFYQKADQVTDERTVWFEEWAKAQRKFLQKYVAHDAAKWSPELTNKVYATQLWQLVKTWEIIESCHLEEAHTWQNTIPSQAAPAAANIPDGPSGMGGSALTNEYYSSAWYELQIVVNSGNHRHRDQTPINWPYFMQRFLKLYEASQKPEPGRLLVAVVKAMQSTDPAVGPENVQEGWRPERNIDPRLLVNPQWTPLFRTLPNDTKLAITEALLAAWLDKNVSYQTARYFSLGSSAASYTPPDELAGVSGGKVWESSAELQASGVRAELVSRVVAWGRAYRDLAQLFHY